MFAARRGRWDKRKPSLRGRGAGAAGYRPQATVDPARRLGKTCPQFQPSPFKNEGTDRALSPSLHFRPRPARRSDSLRPDAKRNGSGPAPNSFSRRFLESPHLNTPAHAAPEPANPPHVAGFHWVPQRRLNSSNVGLFDPGLQLIGDRLRCRPPPAKPPIPAQSASKLLRGLHWLFRIGGGKTTLYHRN